MIVGNMTSLRICALNKKLKSALLLFKLSNRICPKLVRIAQYSKNLKKSIFRILYCSLSWNSWNILKYIFLKLDYLFRLIFDKLCQQLVTKKLLTRGSGWGNVQLIDIYMDGIKACIPPLFKFPRESLGEVLRYWCQNTIFLTKNLKIASLVDRRVRVETKMTWMEFLTV